MSPKNITKITRNQDGSLAYTKEGIHALLQSLMDETSKDGKKDEKKDGKNLLIPDAQQVAMQQKKGGYRDPYLSGLVDGEKETKVNPIQYTAFQPDKVENSDPKKLADYLTRYGGSDETDEAPRLRELVVFKPNRMALHWTAILTSFYVRPDVTLRKKDFSHALHKEGSGQEVAKKWVDKHDAAYVDQVNEIYYRLTGIDRTQDHHLKASGISVWDGKKRRLEQLNEDCAHLKAEIYKEVGKAIKAEVNTLTAAEQALVVRALRNTERKQHKAGDPTSIVQECAALTIYRERANALVRDRMETWFNDYVLKDSKYHKKHYVPTSERQSFVLSGGSATGKSVPMAMLVEKLARGMDHSSHAKWERDGLDLNDAVHMKSETMRTLLLEPEFLKYGNRLFMDESAHEERSLIRDNMFGYMQRVLDHRSAVDMGGKKVGPIIIHDRRSMRPDEIDIMTSDNAPLNYYYFNVRAQEAAARNLARGGIDLGKFKEGEVPEGFNPETYAPRFVNAASNLQSQRRAAQRVLQLIENRKGQAINVMGYSTKVEKGEVPFIAFYADLKEELLHIRRIPRLIDTIQNTHIIDIDPLTDASHALPAWDELIAHPVLEGVTPASIDDLPRATRSDKPSPAGELERANAQYLALWLTHLAQDKKYTVDISTPPIMKTTGVPPNTLFATLYPKNKAPMPILEYVRPNLARILKERSLNGAERGEKRYATFLQTLEKYTTCRETELPGKMGRRLFESGIEYVTPSTARIGSSSTDLGRN